MSSIIYCVEQSSGAGSHVSFKGSIMSSLKEALSYGMTSFQFFLGAPSNSYKRTMIFDQEIKKVNKILDRFPMKAIFTHYPYTTNLAGQVNNLSWSGNSTVDFKLLGILKALEYELSVTASLNCGRCGVVIHPGAFVERNVGLKTIAKTINKIKFPENSVLILENCSNEGNKLAKDFHEIKTILDHLDEDKKKHVKVCVDTAHIHGSGIYDLSKVEEVDRMFYEFNEILGINNFHVLHLNDSKVELGEKRIDTS